MVSVTTALFLSVGLQSPSETLAFAKWEKLKFFWNLSIWSVSFHFKLTLREVLYKNESADAKGETETVICDDHTLLTL